MVWEEEIRMNGGWKRERLAGIGVGRDGLKWWELGRERGVLEA